ncbi:disintegrin and metalloproteinase domain-containing protein 10-like [Tachypleus tridentatus]|uniref:disintegrin and metalloproteinase domain-containing protein 10-like n=1 Tax=Tachypleus tridentatus TaxID=6853 RepID=UPI003FD6BFA6
MKQTRTLLTYFWISLSFISPGENANQLNEYIQHYEPLSYNPEEIHRNHLRDKRSLHSSLVSIRFHAHGRNFQLRLKRDTEVFSPDIIFETADGNHEELDTSHLYNGILFGEPNTTVYGSIRKGVFEGKIHTRNKTYYVERAHKYFGNSTRPFHSIIYTANDVKDPFAAKRKGIAGCGVTESVLQWMQDVSNSADPEVEEANSLLHTVKAKDNKRPKRSVFEENNYHNLYTREVQWRSPPRSQPTRTPDRRACSLYIQTDSFLWEHVKRHESSDTKVKEEIISLVAQHINAVNRIYEDTNFNGYTGIKFVVQRVKINDSSACDTSIKRRSNPYCVPNIDVSNFLNLNSQTNHDEFCLAYVFTYRDFSGGTLGLAWVASASGASGGICEKYKSYTENIGGRQVQNKRSLNTGVITFVNYNSRVPPKVSELTLAHEIGHNFGSPHDYPEECRPGGSRGNYIMYASATSGDRFNNNKFSPCSVRNISAVLQAVYTNNGKENCFLEDGGPFCGNKIVEEGEECDCGWDINECSEICCYPKEVEPYKNQDPRAKPCTRRPGTQCSPSQGPCCTEDCLFENSKKLCRENSDCSYKSVCNGGSALCPTPPPKPNKTECNEGTQVCWIGECSGSICEKYDLEECFLSSDHGVKPEKMCEVACQEHNQPLTCKSTYEIEKMKDIKGIKLRPGSPCNDFKGYCDVFQKCRAVDAEGPLARLKNLLFNQKTLMDIRQWVTTYWWGVMMMLIGLAIFMGLFIKCCAVHTPSSNPRKPPALRITDTLRRPADTLRRKRRHSAHQPGRAAQGRSVTQAAPLQQAPPSEPPPPYSGPSPSAPPSIPGPSWGYGEGRGHYNRKEKNCPKPSVPSTHIEENMYAPARPGRSNVMEMRSKNRA